MPHATSLRLQGLSRQRPRAPARRGRSVKDSAGRLRKGRSRSHGRFMNEGERAARASLLSANGARCAQRDAPIGQPDHAASPKRWSGAGQGEVTHAALLPRPQGLLGVSAPAQPDPAAAFPRPGRAPSRERVSSGPRLGYQASRGARGMLDAGQAVKLPAVGWGRRLRPGTLSLG